LVRQSGAVDAVSPDHQGNHGIVQQLLDPAINCPRVHDRSFPLEADGASSQLEIVKWLNC
jgi:hypothetical protein